MSDATEWRERVATILEIIARDRLPNPHDLDVALDAIECETADEIERLRAERDEHLRLKHMAVEATTRAWAERDRLAVDLAQAHRDILPWIARVGQLIAALDQAEQAMREAGAIYGADAALAALRKEIKA